MAFCPEAGAVDLRFEPQDGGKAMYSPREGFRWAGPSAG